LIDAPNIGVGYINQGLYFYDFHYIPILYIYGQKERTLKNVLPVLQYYLTIKRM
jgi:hypothetical protein